MINYKFRGKSKRFKKWVYGNHIYFESINVHYILPFDKDDLGSAHEIDPTTLGQSTTEVDKKGKEIYQGDRLDIGKSFSVYVVWAFASFMVADGTGSGYESLYKFLGDCEVIGNRHDEPQTRK